MCVKDVVDLTDKKLKFCSTILLIVMQRMANFNNSVNCIIIM